jgi:hypothetical protein
MFKKNPIDEALATALARADQVLGERTRIEAAIGKTAAEMQTTEKELDQALDHLAVDEATFALAEGDAGEHETPAQRRVQSLRLRLEAQQARQRGLNRKVAEHEDQIRDAQDALTVARDGWMRARIAEFASEYTRLVANVAAVLRKGVAIGDALGAPDLSAAMRQAKLYDPGLLSYPMFDMEPVRTNPASGLMERYPVWEDDSAAVAVHNRLVGVRLAAEKLDGVANEIRRRREEAARDEQRRRSAMEPARRTSSYETYYPPEYSALPEVEVAHAKLGK